MNSDDLNRGKEMSFDVLLEVLVLDHVPRQVVLELGPEEVEAILYANFFWCVFASFQSAHGLRPALLLCGFSQPSSPFRLK